MMDSQSPLDQETQKASDPHIYKPDEGEDDEDEIDRRIRRVDERLRRLTIVGAPEFNNDFLCEDTLTVEGGYDTGYAVNYVDCGAAAANQGTTPPPPTECSCAIRVTVGDVILSPCCVLRGDGESANITEVGLNGAIIEGVIEPTWACESDQCFWFDDHGGDVILTTHSFHNADCSDEYHTSGERVACVIGFVGGVYYIVVFSLFGPLGFSPGWLFYGESVSLASPISNLLTACSTTKDDYHLDNAFTDCWNGEPVDTTVFGYDGTVTVELIDVCGACCFDDSVCSSPTTEKICDNRGGTYQGDGTDCDPNPCP